MRPCCLTGASSPSTSCRRGSGCVRSWRPLPTSGRGGRSASTATSRCSRRLAATAHVVEPPAARLAILNCTICSVSVNRVKWRCCRPCVRYVNKPVEALGVSACCRVVPGGRAVGHRWHPNLARLARLSYRAAQRLQLPFCHLLAALGRPAPCPHSPATSGTRQTPCCSSYRRQSRRSSCSIGLATCHRRRRCLEPPLAHTDTFLWLCRHTRALQVNWSHGCTFTPM